MPNELAVHISHIPTEIIQDIFSLCVLPFNSSMDFYYHGASGKGKDENAGKRVYNQDMFRIGCGPWAVGQTCCRWRDIARGTSSLWTHINIDVDDFGGSFERLCTPLQLFLELSRDASLHICLNYHSSYYRSAHPVLDLLIAQSYRWYTADLCISLPKYVILDGVSGRVPRLHRLAYDVINMIDDNEEDARETPSEPSIDFFSTAPQLRSLELKKHEDMHSFRAPWSQLTRLDFRFFDADQLEWFKETTNLKICTITFTSTWYAPSKERITLINLHTLRLHWLGSILDLRAFQFQCIIVPALVELEITTLDKTLGLRGAIISLLRQSRCSLKKFTIHSASKGCKPVLKLLQAQEMHSLEYLCIRGLRTSVLIEHLTLPFTGRRVAPKLHTIDFTLTGHSDFPHHLFVDMIESRWARRLQSSSALPFNVLDEETARLQSVIIRTAFHYPQVPMPPNAKERLQQLQTEGLNVEFLSVKHPAILL